MEILLAQTQQTLSSQKISLCSLFMQKMYVMCLCFFGLFAVIAYFIGIWSSIEMSVVEQ